ncbi:MAG: hypothetical protein HQL52_12775 [Magnetococcales bacterium]|nr:hypothetical protein [Magnetococcales bacterium]
MSTPLHDLQRLVASRKAISGRVVAVTGGMVRVATAQGVVEVAGNATLHVSESVTVRDGVAFRTAEKEHAPVHFV